MEKRATKRIHIPFLADHLAAIIAVMVVITLLLAYVGYKLSYETVNACLLRTVGSADVSLPVKNGRLIGSIVSGTIALMLVVSIIFTAVEWKKCYGKDFKKAYIVAMTVINVVIALVSLAVTVYFCFMLSKVEGYTVIQPIMRFAPAGILLFFSAIHIVLCYILYKPGFRYISREQYR